MMRITPRLTGVLAVLDGAQPAGDFALAQRADGRLQWTHRGRPLYTFSGDAAPGDVTGLGAGRDWRPARFSNCAVLRSGG